MLFYQVPVSVKGIVFENERVWLRKNERNEWELPGGKMEKGEQPIETVARELKEELGFDVEVERLVHAWMYTVQKSTDESKGVLVLSYTCFLRFKSGVFELEGEGGKAEFETFAMEQLKELNMPEFYKEAILRGWKERLASKTV